jgi:long-chain acyl-CoA synthetase
LEQHDTFPKVLAYNAKNWPDEIALREKDFGIWNAFTWAQYNDRVKRFACGLAKLGIGKGDVVGLIGDNRPDWVAGEIAAHAAGATSIGLYRDVLDQEVMYLVTYSEAKVILAEDEEQVDKFLALEDRIPSVKHIIYSDPRGMRKYDDPRLMTADTLSEMGDAVLAEDPQAYDKMIAAVHGDDPAILCTTSGTTAHPKLAVLGGGRVLRHCRFYLEVDPKGPDDEYVSVLPLPWIMEQIYALGEALISRMTVNFVEEPETMMSDMREIGPTFVLLAPRVWEGIAADVRARVMDATPLKQKLFDYGMKLGLEALERGEHSKLADLVLFRALKDRLGFTRLHSAATGGAALGPDTFKFFLAMGIPLRQLYGQTELMGAYTIHRAGDIDYDTVGVPFTSEVEVKIDDPDSEGVGEIVTRHPNMFQGYRRLDAHRRCRVLQRQGPSGGPGPYRRPGDNLQRSALLASVHREQAEVLSLHRRGGDPGGWPRLSGSDDLHSLFDRLQVGGEEAHLLYHL